VMDTMYPVRGRTRPTITDVQAVVAARYSLSTAELVSSGRTARLAWPRQIAIHLSRELTGASLQTIGEAFGGRNHGTVLHACKRVSERAADDQNICGELHSLSSEIRSLLADRDY
jgi:chromosomal replication initiator protein